jgi:hypothetical protein
LNEIFFDEEAQSSIGQGGVEMTKEKKEKKGKKAVIKDLKELGKGLDQKLAGEKIEFLSDEELEKIRVEEEEKRRKAEQEEVLRGIQVANIAPEIQKLESYLLKIKGVTVLATESKKVELRIAALKEKGGEEALGIGKFRALMDLINSIADLRKPDPEGKGQGTIVANTEDYPKLNAEYVKALEMAIEGKNLYGPLTDEQVEELRKQKKLYETVTGRGPLTGKKYHALGYKKPAVRGMVRAFQKSYGLLKELGQMSRKEERGKWDKAIRSSKLSIFELEEGKIEGTFAARIPGWRVGGKNGREITTFIHEQARGKKTGGRTIKVLDAGPGLRHLVGMEFAVGQLPPALRGAHRLIRLHLLEEADKKDQKLEKSADELLASTGLATCLAT